MPTKNLLRTEVTANWERLGRVTGRVLRVDSQEIDGPKGKEIVPYILVEAENRFVRVYKSAALEEMFNVVKVGHFVDIESIGMRNTKSGRECRQFDVRVWEDTDASPVSPAKVQTRRGPVAEETVEESPNAARKPSRKAH